MSSTPCRMPGNIRSVSVVWMASVCLLSSSVWAAPVCANAQAGCHVLSLANLFDRVIQHSSRIHSYSNDLHSEFERYFLPSRNQIGRVNRNCHTSTILTPNGKENAQRMAREELMEVILKLLQAWRDPLWRFHQSMAHQHLSNSFSPNKAGDVSDMVRELRKGVEKLADKMQTLGISNSVSSAVSPETLLPSDGADWRPMTDYDLLYCFRRDSNKVQSYLKILKCRIVPERGC